MGKYQISMIMTDEIVLLLNDLKILFRKSAVPLGSAVLTESYGNIL